jgi:hypothetical protein
MVEAAGRDQPGEPPIDPGRDESYLRSHIVKALGDPRLGSITHLEVRAWVAELSIQKAPARDRKGRCECRPGGAVSGAIGHRSLPRTVATARRPSRGSTHWAPRDVGAVEVEPSLAVDWQGGRRTDLFGQLGFAELLRRLLMPSPLSRRPGRRNTSEGQVLSTGVGRLLLL